MMLTIKQRIAFALRAVADRIDPPPHRVKPQGGGGKGEEK